MKSLPWGKMGDVNLRGKKTKRVADDTAQNFTERERVKAEKALARQYIDWVFGG